MGIPLLSAGQSFWGDIHSRSSASRRQGSMVWRLTRALISAFPLRWIGF